MSGAELSRRLLTALFTIHLPYGFFLVKLAQVSESGTKFGPVGYEIILLYLAGLTTLVLGGSGPFSIDHWLARRSRRPDEIRPRTNSTPVDVQGHSRERNRSASTTTRVTSPVPTTLPPATLPPAPPPR